MNEFLKPKFTKILYSAIIIGMFLILPMPKFPIFGGFYYLLWFPFIGFYIVLNLVIYFLFLFVSYTLACFVYKMLNK